MKLIILESYVCQEGDLDWAAVQAMVPDTICYARTAPDVPQEIAARIGDAEMVILNKCRITEAVLAACPHLRWVSELGTGIDNIDLAACHAHGVAVANVPGYSTYSVAQLTFSLLLAICQCAERLNRAVQDGHWQIAVPPEYKLLPQVELCGKTFGVLGYGNIGRQAARLARAFGMQVLVHTRTLPLHPEQEDVSFVSFETLLAQSDVLSLHCPATPETVGCINADALAQMKEGSILLNTARGALVDEAAVAAACTSGKLAFYGADALTQEPASPDCPLLGVENIILTPHIGWSTAEALDKLADITTQNVGSFLAGKPQNLVMK